MSFAMCGDRTPVQVPCQYWHLRGAGFSLLDLGLASTKPRRLKLAPLKANHSLLNYKKSSELYFFDLPSSLLL